MQQLELFGSERHGHLDGMTQVQIARALGISRIDVIRAEKSIVIKLRAAFGITETRNCTFASEKKRH